MMKKMLLSLLMVALMPFALNAQTANDDLYYVPSKKKEAKIDIKAPVKETTVMVETETPIKVVVRDKKKQVRDIDEYNRRYDSREYEFTEENDTLYIDEREVAELDGEWVNGFDGTEDDYEYAVRLIRFRNPLYAVSVGSPFYWNIVYGMSSWDWNVYTDGYNAYAFPTYTNSLWWNWRYGPIWYNSYWSWYDYYWNYPYYAWHSHYYPYWHHHHHFYPSYVGGRHYTHNAYTNRASRVYRATASTRPNSSRLATNQSRSTSRRAVSTSGSRQTVRTDGEGESRQVRRGTSTTTSTRRVVGTRNSSTSTREQGTSVRSERSTNSNRSTVTRSGSNRSDAASSRRSTYTRPSSTRTTEATSGSSTRRNNTSTYTHSNERSSTNRSSTSTRSYDSGSSSSSRSSSSFSSGSSSRSSSGGGFSSGGGGGSRSGGGGGSRSSRR